MEEARLRLRRRDRELPRLRRIRAIAHAIEKAGSADPAAITKAFWSVDFVGLNGPIRFAKAGPAGKESGQSKPDVYLIEIKDGKVIVPAL